MSKKFNPRYTITADIAQALMQIEAAKEAVYLLPVTPLVLASLRETARLVTTHYSTMIEGNRLKEDQVVELIEHKGHFPGRERDEREVKGYYAALTKVEQYASKGISITETIIQTIHALVMSDGRTRVIPTPYRNGQNVIRDGDTGSIIYMPPEANDVPKLMRSLVIWIKANQNMPCPLIAAITHYQFATIHPYYDGNGRTARLLTMLVLYLSGYDLKGLYSLEEYYAKNLLAYYQAISVGSSHNYYLGREQADITGWIAYFCQGMAYSCQKAVQQMQVSHASGKKDHSALLRTLEPKQRKVLELFREYDLITSSQIAALFGFKARTSAQLCKRWVETGFLKIADPSKKGRTYRLAEKYQAMLER